ncbi:MAG: hypothetical protein H0V46_06075 [Sphingomonas sp.]|nr:hypothetical protein [Sphingomonas sp.]
MIAKLIIASLLVGSSSAGAGQDVARSALDGAEAVWPHMHQCTVKPVSRLAIKTKGTNVQRGPVGDRDGDGWSRIDLHLAGSSDGAPTINAHAISTKGTGTSGRMNGSDSQGRVEIACVKSDVTGGSAAQGSAAKAFAFMSADGKGVGWSCSVSGAENSPVFRVDLLVPTILGQAERRVDYSLSGHGGRVSIVPRSAANNDSWHVACSSKEPRNTNYDLAVLKKA